MAKQFIRCETKEELSNLITRLETLAFYNPLAEQALNDIKAKVVDAIMDIDTYSVVNGEIHYHGEILPDVKDLLK